VLPVVSILWTSSTTPEERTVRRTTTDDTQVSWIQRAITAIPDDNGNVQKWSSASSGAFEKAIEIIELPVGTWTEDYKTFLEAEVAKNGVLKAVDSHYTETDVSFTSGMLPLKTRLTP
jgi:hypothetical protein